MKNATGSIMICESDQGIAGYFAWEFTPKTVDIYKLEIAQSHNHDYDAIITTVLRYAAMVMDRTKRQAVNILVDEYDLPKQKALRSYGVPMVGIQQKYNGKNDAYSFEMERRK